MIGKIPIKYWLIFLLGTAMIGFFNYQAIANFFAGTVDPNEHVIRSLVWKTTTGEEKRTDFSVSRGYLASYVPNDDGGQIVLDVMYPSKTFVQWNGATPPNPSHVTIFIDKIKLIDSRITQGDRFKNFINAGTLETNAYRKVIAQRDKFTVLSSIRRGEEGEEAYLFFDPVTRHWVAAIPKMGGTYRTVDTVLKDTNITVGYQYRNDLEPNPITIYNWVMEFVDVLQTSNTKVHKLEK